MGTLSRREALGGEPKLLLNISCFGPLSFILSSDDKASLYIKSSDKPGVSAPLSYNERSLPAEKVFSGILSSKPVNRKINSSCTILDCCRDKSHCMMKDFYNSSGDREGLYYNKPGD